MKGRRYLLAAAMIRRPDVLLLAEPTDHLDIELDCLAAGVSEAVRGDTDLCDSSRIRQELANRIIEVDRGSSL
jgi:ABC-type uncharacterized transport system ATPase subunit